MQKITLIGQLKEFLKLIEDQSNYKNLDVLIMDYSLEQLDNIMMLLLLLNS